MVRPILYFLVTNSLHQDQRLQKICRSLSDHKFDVHLVGVNKRSTQFSSEHFECHSLSVLFETGPLFYFEINLRFILFLMFKQLDAVVANDLDTLLAAKIISILRRKKLFIDLHEYFTEVPELEGKPFKKRIWNWIGKFGIGNKSINYTVNKSLAKIFEKKYNAPFHVVYNFPNFHLVQNYPNDERKIKMVYVGMINKGRGLKETIKAMIGLENISLTIFGDGDEFADCQKLIEEHSLGKQVNMKGFVDFDKVKKELPKFDLGLNLLQSSSKNYYYSSANKFFDYIMAGLPSLSMQFPEYQYFNQVHEVSILLDQCNSELIRETLSSIASDPDKLHSLKENCSKAREEWKWETQVSTLREVYNSLQIT